MNNSINIEALPNALLGYFRKFMLVHVREDLKFWYLLAAKAQIPGKISEYMPMIKNAGIIDDNGNIDLDKLQKLAEETFSEIPKAYIGNFDFDAADLPQIINYLKNGERG